jgi:lipoic acid synthetase
LKKNQVVQGVKLKGADKVARIPIKVVPSKSVQRKPPWIRARAPIGDRVKQLKARLRENSLYTVCEEAACPNLGECFSKGTATFMIMGDICTRRCPFCDVGHGRPNQLDVNEPANLAKTIHDMALRYVVITSVDRDDLRDGGAGHFVDCIRETRKLNPAIKIEILTPDFRGRMDVALEIMTKAPPDVFNHNLESVPSLYRKIRPGSDYEWSLDLLQKFRQMHPQVPTKSGLMLGLGEEIDEVKQVLRGNALSRRRNLTNSAPMPNRSASTRLRVARWCVLHTTPICRPNPSSVPDPLISTGYLCKRRRWFSLAPARYCWGCGD